MINLRKYTVMQANLHPAAGGNGDPLPMVSDHADVRRFLARQAREDSAYWTIADASGHSLATAHRLIGRAS